MKQAHMSEERESDMLDDLRDPMAFDSKSYSIAGRYLSIQAPVGGHGLSPEARRRSRGRHLGKDVGYALSVATCRDSGMSCSSIEGSEISCEHPELARRSVAVNREARCDIPVVVVVVPARASRSRRRTTAAAASRSLSLAGEASGAAGRVFRHARSVRVATCWRRRRRDVSILPASPMPSQGQQRCLQGLGLEAL